MSEKMKLKNFLSVSLMFLGTLNMLYSQCDFRCNDTINVSVNNMCMATITPDMLLEAFEENALSCNYTIQIQNSAGVNITSAPNVGSQYVGQFLTARIYLTGRPTTTGCWSILKIEDKLPPEVFCLNRDTLDCTASSDIDVLRLYIKAEIERGLVDNCGNRTVDINILGVDQSTCTNGFSTTRIVDYAVLQNREVIKTCRDTFLYRSLLLDSISQPKNYTENMVLPCTGPYPTVQHLLSSPSTHREAAGLNSLPNIRGRSLFDLRDSLFVERGLCNIKATYSDQVLPSCGASYKVVRTWVMLDWCYGATRLLHQVIKVVDTQVIIASGCVNILDQTANEGTCTAMVTLPSPTVSANECSSWTYTILIREPGGDNFVAFGGSRNSGTTSARAFPIGISRVRYVVKDACDNQATCEFNVEVKDKSEPHAICDAVTVVTLNDNLVAKVFATSIDGKSFDACGDIVSMKIRRMDRANSGCGSPLDWDDSAKFCCEDIGKLIMLEFRVTDEAGLTNICMAEVHVQYKGPGPQVTCAPNIPTQNCANFSDFNINQLTPPAIRSTNTCIANALTPIIREKERNIDICGKGYIDIEWVVNYSGTEETICAQRINFTPPRAFAESDIRWPANRTVVNCTDAPPTQQEISDLIQALPCGNVIASEPIDTRIVDNVNGGCIKIQRAWTVVDWCRYPANPSARWTYIQTITLLNTSPPVFDAAIADVVIQDNQSSCRAFVDITGLASDDCSAQAQLVWTHRLELLSGNNSIVIINSTAGRTLTRALDFGEYRISFTATDECGNSSQASRVIDLRDRTGPLLSCNSLVRDINTDTLNPALTLSAEAFVSGVSDNCSQNVTVAIRRLGSTNYTNSLSFSCQDLGVRQIEVQATDDNGNISTCIAFLDIRDGNGTCGFGAIGFTLSGTIRTTKNNTVENVGVHLIATNSDKSFETLYDGNYAFANIQNDQKLKVVATKQNDYLNGVSTLDLVLIQRHILGVKKFDQPAAYIAADVNMSKSISSADLVTIRRLLLGQLESFPNRESWLIVPEEKMPQSIETPWLTTLEYSIDNLERDMNNAHFVAIKLGDVDQNAVANSKLSKSRSLESMALRIVEGENTIELYPTQAMQCSGLQLSLILPNNVVLRNISSQLSRFSPEMTHLDGQVLNISWFDAKDASLDKDIPLLTLHFEETKDLSDISLNENWANQLYDDKYIVRNLELIMESKKETGDIVLNQNVPNPFSDHTDIEFFLYESTQVEFHIFNVNGEVIHKSSDFYPKGSSTIRIDRYEQKLNKGIYYYMIKTQKRSLIKKMLIF